MLHILLCTKWVVKFHMAWNISQDLAVRESNPSQLLLMNKNLNPLSHVAFVFLLYSVHKPGIKQSFSRLLCLHT